MHHCRTSAASGYPTAQLSVDGTGIDDQHHKQTASRFNLAGIATEAGMRLRDVGGMDRVTAGPFHGKRRLSPPFCAEPSKQDPEGRLVFWMPFETRTFKILYGAPAAVRQLHAEFLAERKAKQGN